MIVRLPNLGRPDSSHEVSEEPGTVQGFFLFGAGIHQRLQSARKSVKGIQRLSNWWTDTPWDERSKAYAGNTVKITKGYAQIFSRRRLIPPYVLGERLVVSRGETTVTTELLAVDAARRRGTHHLQRFQQLTPWGLPQPISPAHEFPNNINNLQPTD